MHYVRRRAFISSRSRPTSFIDHDFICAVIVAIFSAGILAVIALIINYLKRGDVQGSIFASHFTWQIRSFWWYLFWNIVAFVPFFLVFFSPDAQSFASMTLAATLFCIAVVAISWLWIVYRAIRGLIRVNDNLPMYH